MKKLKSRSLLLVVVLLLQLSLSACANTTASSAPETSVYPSPYIAKSGAAGEMKVEFDNELAFPNEKEATIFSIVTEQDECLEASVSQAVGIELSKWDNISNKEEGGTYYSIPTLEGRSGKANVFIQQSTGYWQFSFYENPPEHLEIHDFIAEKQKTSDSLPTEDEAIEIAKYYIANNKLYDGDLGEPVLSTTTTGSDELVIERHVTFFPKIDGRNVYGIFRISISIGADGKIIGVLKQASPVDEVATDLLKSKDVVIQEVLNDNESVSISTYDLKNAVVTQCHLAYYVDASSHDGVAYAYPVYVLIGQGSSTASEKDEEIKTFDIIVDAARR